MIVNEAHHGTDPQLFFEAKLLKPLQRKEKESEVEPEDPKDAQGPEDPKDAQGPEDPKDAQGPSTQKFPTTCVAGIISLVATHSSCLSPEISHGPGGKSTASAAAAAPSEPGLGLAAAGQEDPAGEDGEEEDVEVDEIQDVE